MISYRLQKTSVSRNTEDTQLHIILLLAAKYLILTGKIKFYYKPRAANTTS